MAGAARHIDTGIETALECRIRKINITKPLSQWLNLSFIGNPQTLTVGLFRYPIDNLMTL
jgi:hypothetical protein